MSAVSSEERNPSMLAPSLVTLAWTIAVAVPSFFFVKRVFQFNDQTTLFAALLLLNGAVGVFWIIGSLKTFVGVAATTLSTTELGSAALRDDDRKDSFWGAGMRLDTSFSMSNETSVDSTRND